MENQAYEEAETTVKRALATADGQQIDGRIAELHFILGCAQSANRIWDESREHLTQAFDYYFERGNTALALEVAISIAPGANPDILGLKILPRALDIAKDDSLETGYLLASYSIILGISQVDYEGARKAFEQAIAI